MIRPLTCVTVLMACGSGLYPLSDEASGAGGRSADRAHREGHHRDEDADARARRGMDRARQSRSPAATVRPVPRHHAGDAQPVRGDGRSRQPAAAAACAAAARSDTPRTCPRACRPMPGPPRRRSQRRSRPVSPTTAPAAAPRAVAATQRRRRRRTRPPNQPRSRPAKLAVAARPRRPQAERAAAAGA